ncbi:hypothetical protein CRM22_007908 [Opisthorchis felineus]|uniref:Uncharacterized protein n=1 Tax=Opisthorchis felineus TaxID=147828 RepID=A0A4S2LFU8_OPIFE|nr:hypothetical protein CRM22_007908 [Opisthorchis felineus]
MQEAETERTLFPIPKLKSIVAVFVGLFCIICFKKLIVFGRRWKNMIVNWGYRSLNVPSLWISDAFVQGNSSDPGSGSSVPTSTGLRNGNLFTRVPALRLPDAWPNFLLTWLCLNFDTMSSLIPSWTAAINEELAKLCTKDPVNGTKEGPISSTKQLHLKAIQKSSVPPRLSAIETSASGSTKELHFHCTFSSPEVMVEAVLTQPKALAEDDSSSTESYLVQMQQISCRVQIVCAALEGDYVLLSWKMVSPLLVQRLSLLTMDREPVSTLSPSDVRWIKDYLYLSIQTAVVRVILNPFYLTPVQQSFPAESLQRAKATEHQIRRSHEPSSRTARAAVGDAIRLRVIYAILLEPTELGPLDPLLQLPLRCEIRGNPNRLPLRSDISTDVTSETLLLSTDGVYLKPKTIPGDQLRPGKTFLNGRLQSTIASSYVAVWNQDAFVPTDKLTSDLLDVVLCTDATASLAPSTHLFGHAVLPLPTYGETPTKSQHVLLIDCHAGEPGDRWMPRTKMLGDVRAKFMLILHADLFASSRTVECQDDRGRVQGSRLTSNLSNEAGIRSSEHVASQSMASRQSPQSPDRPLNNLTSSLLGASTSSDPSQSSLFQVGDSSTPLKASSKRKLFSLRLFRGSRRHRPKVSRSEDFEHLKLEDSAEKLTSHEPAEFRASSHDRSKLRRLLGRRSSGSKHHPGASSVEPNSLLSAPRGF